MVYRESLRQTGAALSVKESCSMPYPTPYPDVNAVLDRLLSDVQTVLGDYFAGMYLYGSLSSGDFDPQRSDIDFLVVTTGELPGEMIAALEAMHSQIMSSGLKWARKLEGSYIPRDALRRYDPAGPPYPTLNEGRFYVAPHGSDWIIQRHIIREHGVTLAGPAPHTLIDPVQPDDLRRAVRGILAEWWAPMLDNPAWLRSDEYQAYAVLTMCRALHTLEHGDIVSKPVAARWVRDTLGEPWAALIERALTWQPGAPWDELGQTLGFIRYTLARAL
jgi:predicted nucleotidyltransferase